MWQRGIWDFGLSGPEAGKGVKFVIVAPGIDNNQKGLHQNHDGSYDLYFGPKAPANKEGNWLQTVPGKGWNIILRLYGPLQPWFDKTWMPGDIEIVQ